MHAVPTELFRARCPADCQPVSLGYRTVELVAPGELQSAQVGYAVDPSGRALTGENPGDWSPHWLVVATEDECGDPIFVDASRPEWPVYTAAHGAGDWIPELIADSFTGLLGALDAVRVVARGRDTPVALEHRPIARLERDEVLAQIANANPRASLSFWRNWLAT